MKNHIKIYFFGFMFFAGFLICCCEGTTIKEQIISGIIGIILTGTGAFCLKKEIEKLEENTK